MSWHEPTTSHRIHRSGQNRLVDMAETALDLPARAGLLRDSAGRQHQLAPTQHCFGALVGLRCPPEIIAVASTIQADISYRGQQLSGRVAWSADRNGRTVVRARCSNDQRILLLESPVGRLYDISRRAFGLGTMPCTESLIQFVDAAFWYRAREFSSSGLGDPPTDSSTDIGIDGDKIDGCKVDPVDVAALGWEDLVVLHSMSRGEPVSADELWRRRRLFESTHTWASLRRSAIQLPLQSLPIARGLSAGVAGWLDDGSFGRWLLAELPDAAEARSRVSGSVPSDVAEQLLIGLRQP